MNIQSIPLDRVILEGPGFEDYIFTYPLDSASLTTSIQEFGLLHPVLVTPEGTNWKIVCGARRIMACRELGWTEIPARVAAADRQTPVELLQLSLAEDLGHRTYNPVEKARVLHRFLTLADWPHERLVESLAARLDLPPSLEVIKDTLSLLQLDQTLLHAIATGDLSHGHAILLAALTPRYHLTIHDRILRNCQPSLSEFREIIANLQDLSAILSLKPDALLETREFAIVLDDSQANPRKKCRNLRALLRERRYPHLSGLEASFARIRDACQLSGIQVRPSPFFETDQVEFVIRADSEEQLQNALDSCNKALARGAIKRLFGLAKADD